MQVTKAFVVIEHPALVTASNFGGGSGSRTSSCKIRDIGCGTETALPCGMTSRLIGTALTAFLLLGSSAMAQSGSDTRADSSDNKSSTTRSKSSHKASKNSKKKQSLTGAQGSAATDLEEGRNRQNTPGNITDDHVNDPQMPRAGAPARDPRNPSTPPAPPTDASPAHSPVKPPDPTAPTTAKP